MTGKFDILQVMMTVISSRFIWRSVLNKQRILFTTVVKVLSHIFFVFDTKNDVYFLESTKIKSKRQIFLAFAQHRNYKKILLIRKPGSVRLCGGLKFEPGQQGAPRRQKSAMFARKIAALSPGYIKRNNN